MKKFHKIVTYLPYVIIGYCLLSYIYGQSDFYHKYFELLDTLDFIPVTICLYHFILNLGLYDKVKTVLVLTILQMAIMYKLRYAIDNDLYWWMYLSILFGGIAIAFITYLFTRRE